MKGEQEKERNTDVPYKEDVDDDPIPQEDQAKKKIHCLLKEPGDYPPQDILIFLWLDISVNQ